MNITKLDLACDLRRRCRVPLTIAEYQSVIETFLYCFRERLKAGEKIVFRRFGSFQVFQAKAHKSNITGEIIPAHAKIRAKLYFKL